MPAALLDLDIFSAEREPGRESAFLILLAFLLPPLAKMRFEARERLLAAASLLFYAEGIKSVGIERILKEGQVTLATFYRHLPSKVHLVVA
jgi:hypothetical protein